MVAQQLRARGLAVEPLLQIVERGHCAVAQDEKLAIEGNRRRHRLDNLGKSSADVVAGARLEPPLAAASDELHADAVPFPLGEVVARVETFELRILERL